MTRKLHLFLLTLLMGLPMAVLAAGTSWQTATTLGLDGSASGTLSEDNTEAWYKIDVPENGALTMTFTPSGELDLYWCKLYALDGENILRDRGGNWPGKDQGTFTVNDVAKGTYYVRLQRNSGSGSYTVSNSLNRTSARYANDSEPNDEWQQATKTLSNHVTATGHLGYWYYNDTDKQDWYKVEVPENGSITVTVTPHDNLDLYWCNLYALDGENILRERGGKWPGAEEGSFTVDDVAKGTYYVRIQQNSAEGGYSLRYDFTPTSDRYANDSEPNDEWQQATKTLSNHVTATGHLGYWYYNDTDKQDWYKVEVPENGSITVTVTPHDNLDLYWCNLYALDGENILRERGGKWPGAEEGSFTVDDVAKGTYYIRIQQNSAEGGYTLRTDFTPRSATHPDDQEPNDSWQQAQYLGRGATATGHLGYLYYNDTDKEDWFRIVVPRDGTIRLNYVPTGGLDLYWCYVYALDANNVLRDRAGQWKGTEPGELVVPDALPGTYYVRMHQNSAEGSYTLKYTFEQNDYATDAEPNDEQSQAVPLAEGVTVAGHLGYNYYDDTDNNDYYRLTLDKKGTIEINFQPTGELDLYYTRLYDSEGHEKGSRWSSKEAGQIKVDDLDAGTYYVRVQRNSGYGTYFLSYNAAIGSVEHQKPLPDEDVTETEATPGTAWDGGGTITPGSVVYQPMNADGKSHWYQLTISDDGQADITISLRDGLDISSMTLYARNVAKGENESRGRIDVEQNGTGTLTAKNLAPGTYYLNIEHWSGDGYYTLTTRFTPCTVASDRELNDTWQQASQTLYPGQTMTGHMGYSYLEMDKDVTDWVKIHVPTDGAITLTLQPQESLDFYAVRLGFVKADGSDTEWQGASAEGGLGETVTLTQQDVAAGDYYLYMPHWSGYGGYTLSYRHEPNAYGNDREPNDTWQTAAVALEQGQTLTGHLGYVKYNQRDEHDWYVVNIDEKSNLDITVQVAPTLDLENLYLYRQNGSNIEQVAVIDVNNGETKTLSVNDLEPGTYFVDVHLWSSGYGHYFLSASKHIGTPDNPQPKDDTPIVPGGDAIDEFTLWYTLDIGGTVAYKLAEKPQVRLLGAETTVTSSRGVMTFETQKIWKFTLTASSTDPSVGIEEAVAPVQPESEGSVSRSGEALVFSGCRAGEPVGVYTTCGRLVSQHRIAADGTLELSLGSLRPGLYIVKAGSVNIKFMKK